MTERPVTRSLTLRGHRTSVSLEDVFWTAFRNAAKEDGIALNELAAMIDEERGDIGLASAIRVWLFQRAVARGHA